MEPKQHWSWCTLQVPDMGSANPRMRPPDTFMHSVTEIMRARQLHGMFGKAHDHISEEFTRRDLVAIVCRIVPGENWGVELAGFSESDLREFVRFIVYTGVESVCSKVGRPRLGLSDPIDHSDTATRLAMRFQEWLRSTQELADDQAPEGDRVPFPSERRERAELAAATAVEEVAARRGRAKRARGGAGDT